MTRKDDLADEAAMWQMRAEHWRRVACEYAAGVRKAYDVPLFGAIRLREDEEGMDWGDPRYESRSIATNYVNFKGMP